MGLLVVSMWLEAILSASPRRTGGVVLLIVCACNVPDDAESDLATEALGTGGETSGAETTWGEPEICETRQQGLGEEFDQFDNPGPLLGPTDIQAVCQDGEVVALHRPSSVSCESFDLPLSSCQSPGDECFTDADCVAVHGSGTCAAFDGVGGACACVIPCETDDDCAQDRACLCRTGIMLEGGSSNLVGVSGCYPADCRTDDDCGPSGQCAFTNPHSTCVQISGIHLRCRTADGCQSDSDCPDSDPVCAPTPDASTDWQCTGRSTCQ